MIYGDDEDDTAFMPGSGRADHFPESQWIPISDAQKMWLEEHGSHSDEIVITRTPTNTNTTAPRQVERMFCRECQSGWPS